MTTQAILTFKAESKIKLEEELQVYQLGKKPFNGNTQFNETILEDALENFDSMPDGQWVWWVAAESSIMALANALSVFEAPTLSTAWTD